MPDRPGSGVSVPSHSMLTPYRPGPGLLVILAILPLSGCGGDRPRRPMTAQELRGFLPEAPAGFRSVVSTTSDQEEDGITTVHASFEVPGEELGLTLSDRGTGADGEDWASRAKKVKGFFEYKGFPATRIVTPRELTGSAGRIAQVGLDVQVGPFHANVTSSASGDQARLDPHNAMVLLDALDLAALQAGRPPARPSAHPVLPTAGATRNVTPAGSPPASPADPGIEGFRRSLARRKEDLARLQGKLREQEEFARGSVGTGHSRKQDWERTFQLFRDQIKDVEEDISDLERRIQRLTSSPRTAASAPVPKVTPRPAPPAWDEQVRALLGKAGGCKDASALLERQSIEERCSALFQALRARTGQACGEADQAAEAVTLYLHLSPESPDEVQEVRVWLSARAAPMFGQALSMRKTDPHKALETYLAAFRLDRSLVGKDDPRFRKAALRTLAQAADKDPESARARFDLGYYQYVVGDLEAAVKTMALAREREKDPYRGWILDQWSAKLQGELAGRAPGAAEEAPEE